MITGGEKARGIVIQAFEFAVFKVGIDLSSGDLWSDYLEFLKSWTTAASWEEQQKIDLIRKVYKKLLAIPYEKLETMWSTYTKWENLINSSTASRFIAEKSTDFMEARSWNTEWRNLTEGLLRRETIPARPGDEYSKILKKQIELWHRWIDFEKKNKLNLNEENLNERIEYVYKQALFALPFVPEMWFRYTDFLLQVNEDANLSKCVQLLIDGLKMNPRSFLLSFQLSELYEKDNSSEKAIGVYGELLAILMNDFELLHQNIDSIASSVKPRENPASNLEKGDPVVSKDSDIADNKEDDDINDNVYQLSESDGQKLVDLKVKQQDLSDSITLVYIKHMNTSKRLNGIKEARKVFKRARDSFRAIGPEIYVENALMEYHSENQTIASRVFDLGMNKFKNDGAFLLAYLDFLVMINKAESMKVVFELGLSSLLEDIKKFEEDDMSQKSSADLIYMNFKRKDIEKKRFFIREMVKMLVKYQSIYGDIGLIKSLDKRYKEYFPRDDHLKFFIERYKDDKIDPIRKYDLAEEETTHKTLMEEKVIKKQKKNLPSPELKDEPALVENSKGSTGQQHNFVGNNVYNLLRVLPNSSYFGPQSDHVFNSEKLVDFFSNLSDIPDSA